MSPRIYSRNVLNSDTFTFIMKLNIAMICSTIELDVRQIVTVLCIDYNINITFI